MKNPQKPFPIYPILIGIFPVISLMAYNIWELEPATTLRSLVVCLLFAVVLWFALSLVMKNHHQAALFSTVISLLFFSYGHVYDYFQNVSVLGMVIGKHRFLLPLWALIFVSSGWLSIKLKNLDNITRLLNVAAIGMLLLPAYKLADYSYQSFQNRPGARSIPGIATLQKPASNELPDIYYIVLDTYGRDDEIIKYLGYDNTPFLKQLEDMGFYVSYCSQSNYNGTIASLTSSLNMNYLENLDRNVSSFFKIRNNAAMDNLKNLGYQTVAFETGYDWTQVKNADLYLKPTPQFSLILPFEDLLIHSTILRLVQEVKNFYNPERSSKDIYVNRQLFLLDQLQKIPSMPGPKFIFAHVLIPHQPFQFSASGVLDQPVPVEMNGKQLADEQTYARGYTGQVEFINQQLLKILPEIISQSAVKPIIIIQGDHGFFHGEDRLVGILNVYFMPQEISQNLYPGITPVNTFRLIFDSYFGTSYGLLPDKSFQNATLVPQTQRAECR